MRKSTFQGSFGEDEFYVDEQGKIHTARTSSDKSFYEKDSRFSPVMVYPLPSWKVHDDGVSSFSVHEYSDASPLSVVSREASVEKVEGAVGRNARKLIGLELIRRHMRAVGHSPHAHAIAMELNRLKNLPPAVYHGVKQALRK